MTKLSHSTAPRFPADAARQCQSCARALGYDVAETFDISIAGSKGKIFTAAVCHICARLIQGFIETPMEVRIGVRA